MLAGQDFTGERNAGRFASGVQLLTLTVSGREGNFSA